MISNTTTKLNIKLAVPFFMVRNMDTSLNFYVNQLGFKITNQWEPHGKIEWCWLQRDAVAMMLQERRQPAEEDAKPGHGVSTCFQCEDALALYHEFTGKGISVKDPFVGNNMWVVCFSDPDGYNLDFESPTDVPEETTYSGNG